MDTVPAKERSPQPFLAALRQIRLIEKSMPLGKPVPEAFSLKIQRRLASTVPPRPMVHVSAADAIAHMTRFCQDAVDVQQILEYRGPYNLQVCFPPTPLFFIEKKLFQIGFSFVLDFSITNSHFYVFFFFI